MFRIERIRSNGPHARSHSRSAIVFGHVVNGDRHRGYARNTNRVARDTRAYRKRRKRFRETCNTPPPLSSREDADCNRNTSALRVRGRKTVVTVRAIARPAERVRQRSDDGRSRRRGTVARPLDVVVQGAVREQGELGGQAAGAVRREDQRAVHDRVRRGQAAVRAGAGRGLLRVPARRVAGVGDGTEPGRGRVDGDDRAGPRRVGRRLRVVRPAVPVGHRRVRPAVRVRVRRHVQRETAGPAQGRRVDGPDDRGQPPVHSDGRPAAEHGVAERVRRGQSDRVQAARGHARRLRLRDKLTFGNAGRPAARAGLPAKKFTRPTGCARNRLYASRQRYHA